MPDGGMLAFNREVVDYQNARILAQLGQPRAYWEDVEGYQMLYVTSDDRVMAIKPLLFTTAIIGDLDADGYAERWCYETPKEAITAYLKWIVKDCKGEPKDWCRHPRTGRRVIKNENRCEINVF